MNETPFAIKDVLKILESGTWCGPIRFITANVHKGTGGEVREIKKVRISRSTPNLKDERQPVIVMYEGKDPKHRLNFTRNVELPNRSIITIHPALVTHINGREVI
jgi:hypothetical protein